VRSATELDDSLSDVCRFSVLATPAFALPEFSFCPAASSCQLIVIFQPWNGMVASG